MPNTSASWSIVGSIAPVAWLKALAFCGLFLRHVADAVPTHPSQGSATPLSGSLSIAGDFGVSAGAMLFWGPAAAAARNGELLAAWPLDSFVRRVRR